ncbi:unnamed protein product [Dracunculus medinensis]|uniref:adenylate cyclase n=1 Tax=Dracunculus medinensis TaxID=318479 RepID=A0A0N4UJR5_DRAME|nr:unnamed protein product [Dracunculus medinensis]
MNSSVVYGRLIGLEDIFAQCSIQDCARLLNEFSTRINRIAEKNECMRIQSDGILVVSGAPNFREDHAKLAVKFACDVQALVKSFCDSTTADLGFRSGIESGAVICGTIGTNKWHYDVVGIGVFLADNAKEQVVDDYNMENYGCYWRILPEKASALPSSLLFPCLRRFSLATIPQAVNRLLQSISSKSDSLHASSALPGRRKRKSENIPLSCNKLDANETKEKSLIDEATLRFRNVKMETAYHSQADQWFIPALAISIFYLVIYAVYHVLVLPRQIATLIMIVMTLAVMFIILLMIYIDYFENFCQFITRTLFGQSIGTLLILTMLFICGIVNTYSCPQNGGSKVDLTSECFVVHFSLYNCVFWMLTTVAFVRFSSFILFLSLIVAFILYSFHVFITHPELYYSYSQYTQSSSVELELLNGLLVFAFLIFLQARRNERILRFDFMSKLKEVEEKSELERTEALNQKMLQNILPHHIAQSFFAKSELYYHLCHSGGVIYISIVLDDKDIDSNMSSLRNIVSTIDQVLAKYSGIEKIKNCQKFYIAAVGIIPETCSNVHDTPSTIGDLLNELTQFALTISAIAASQGIGLNIGIECGSLLSAVISAHNPVYEIVGKACERARTLMEHADCYGIMVSEEIYLALRPRNFNFDSRPIKIDMAITAYVFEESYPVEESDAQSAIDAAEHSQSLNPLGMFASMNSSFTSEAYSLDIGVEVESDMEWITPEMILSDHRGEYPSTSGIGMSQYIPSSSNPRSEGSLSPERLRNRRMHSGRFMGLMNCSTISDTGQSCNGADRLAAAAFRVDRMLEELNAVAELSSKNDCCPFPTALSMSTRSLRREISSACHTEYDNAESEGLCSDSEILGGRLEQLKKALKQCRASSERRKRRKFWNNFDNGNDADIDSICSSLNVSSIFGNFRWNR